MISHKQQCIGHCKDYLQNLNLSEYFNTTDFEHIYRKFNGAQGNAFSIGLHAADFIIINAKPLTNETGNEDKREELKGISRVLQQAVKSGAYKSVNEGLVSMYAEQGHTEIHSYIQWRERGCQVKRGSKALLLWGEPRSATKQEKPEQKNDNNNEDDEYKFFPLAYVFSQQHVEPFVTENMKR